MFEFLPSICRPWHQVVPVASHAADESNRWVANLASLRRLRAAYAPLGAVDMATGAVRPGGLFHASSPSAEQLAPEHHSWARISYCICRRKSRSETSDNMDRWKSRGGKSQRGEAKKWEEQRREGVRRKKMQVRERVGKSRFNVFFQWFVALGGRKVGSLKRRVRSHLARWEMKNCTPLWREAHSEVKMYKAPQLQNAFRSWDVEKVHAVVAWSTFPTQNAQNSPMSDHCWKLRCRKNARRCGAKHISKSNVSITDGFGPLLEVQMSKKCRATFGRSNFEKVHAIVARSTFPSQKCQKLAVFGFSWCSDVEKVHTD